MPFHIERTSSVCILWIYNFCYHFSHDESSTMIVACFILIGVLTLFFLVLKSMAVGNPAKVVGYTEKEDPSLSMKHGKYMPRFLQAVFLISLAMCC
jgi:hypothetical protein